MRENMATISKQRLKKVLSDVAREYFQESDYSALLQTSRIAYLHMLLKELKTRKNANIRLLEIGCGAGFNLLVLEKIGFKELIGVDVLSPDTWRLKKPLNFHYLTRDVCSSPLPFGDNSCHVVLLIDVLEHLYDPAYLLKEVSRILSADGLLVIRTPNIANLRNRILLLFGKSPHLELEGFLFKHRVESSRIYLGHVREYTGYELRQMFSSFGFKVLSLKYFCAEPFGKSRRYLLKLYTLFESFYPKWKSIIVVLAEK